MTKDNKENNRTADAAEMKTNQSAYQLPSEDNDVVIIKDGVSHTKHEVDGVEVDITPTSRLKPQNQKILYRTDVDEYNTKYKTSDLQTHNTGSGLDITSYSMYSGFKEPGKEPEKVIVGVAGSGDFKDWGQNFNLDINRSRYNNDSNEKLQNELKDNFWHWHDKSELKYELEIRQKVQGLQKYRENGIPISVVGDSKGGEDAAYLALSFIKSTETGGNRYDYDYSAVSVYLTNPKGVRVSKEDREILQKMADAGKITIEVVYPEIVGNLGAHKLPEEIPYSHKIFTVPNKLCGSLSNHIIGGYETKVYQGFVRNYKFQCDEEPTVLSEMQWVEEEGSTIGSPSQKVWKSVDVGYRYVVSRVTDKSGKTMSVNDYFFAEQIQKMARLRDEMRAREAEYLKIKNEPILEYFTSEVDRKKYSLKEKHKQWISNATPFEMYYQEHKDLIQTQDATRYLLERDYEELLESHVDSESVNYKGVVKNRVERYIIAYQERVDNEMMRLKQKAERIDTDVIPSIQKAQSTFIKSQKQIQLIIEKRN